MARIRAVNRETFSELALDVFRYQARYNSTYARYLDLLRRDAASVTVATDIPHLPISLFKTHDLRAGADWQPTRTFTSSGTTGAATSHHPLRAEAWYRQNARRAFELQYGSLRNRAVLALLPAYLERTGSSLVFMADDFIRESGREESGFFLDDLAGLSARLQSLKNDTLPPLLIGVSFALLDLAEQFSQDLGHTIIMETGGMKGRRKELTRAELHGTLGEAFAAAHIHSEYGMTELLSQAYAPRAGIFYPAPTMSVTTRDVTDPFTTLAPGRAGAINITDLANLDTISFIATDDLGRVGEDGTFEVLGRLDASDVRGCNLLVL
ncbi:acyl transferase [Lewinella sp. 4G2]|nr:acyl transferase [Lewinella sp. 4G2]